MGDESEAVFLSLFDYDIHVRYCFSAEYTGWGTIDMDVLEAGRMGCQEVEKKTTGLVEGRWEEVGEKDYDMCETGKSCRPDICYTISH
jgi:hypothetical protein